MRKLVVIEAPGLSHQMVADHAPNIAALGTLGRVAPEVPALTLPAHASIITGKPAHEHGVIGNGWFFRDHNEVMMWRQSEGLVHAEKVWETAKQRDPAFTCLKHFWWPGMGSTADIHTNVRPAYFADGRKSGDVYANQPGLAAELTEKHGAFPLFHFWGPAADITSTQWIADSARTLFDKFTPTLSLVYLPHLDYKQQTLGPDHPSITAEVAALDRVVGELTSHVRAAGAEVMLLSSYTMQPVSRPLCLNRVLREAGFLQVMRNPTGELIDFGMSRAFAVCDHQIAQVYVRDPNDIDAVKSCCEALPGVASAKPGRHTHEGELILTAEPDAWFAYPWWLDDADAPDFARSVAIHAKPGYDPCEMLIDPALSAPKLKIVSKVLRKKLGFRMVMDVIPLDPSLIKGSHGILPQNEANAPAYVSTVDPDRDPLPLLDLRDEMLRIIFD